MTGLALLMLIALATGCSSGQSTAPASVDDSSPGSGGAPLVPSDVTAIPTQPAAEPNPLSAFRLTDEDKDFVYETWQLGMQSCMGDLGFQYDPVNPDDLPADPTIASDSEDVALYGYDFPPGSDEMFQTANDDRIADDPAYKSAFLGPDGSSGCRGNAQTRAFGEGGDFGNIDSIIAEAYGAALEQAGASDALPALNQKWAACMAKDGHSFDTPGAALAEYNGGATTPLEINTRVADLACQAETTYELTFSQIVNDYAKKWMDANPGSLQQWTTAKDAYLADLRTYRSEQSG